MFHLPKLPYSFDGLSPKISDETLKTHYEGHHKTYVTKLNTLLEKEKQFQGLSLLEIVKQSKGDLFNNSAQAWNHSFYWFSMAPNKTQPEGKLEKAIQTSFGTYAKFQEKFLDLGTKLFGSGWLWLVKDSNGNLELETTKDADNPVLNKKIPLIVCDIWEHAYYIDYRNKRPEYLEAYFKIINWAYANENFERKSPPEISFKMGGPSDLKT